MLSTQGSRSSGAASGEKTLVVSASRRTDLVSCHAAYLIEKLSQYPPDRVHTLVIWTKNPQNMVAPGPLRECLSCYAQLYVHLTITGLGETVLEPRIPPWQSIVHMLPGLVEFVKSPERVVWRFDPIICVESGGQRISNFELFPDLAEKAGGSGITTCKTSWVEPYKKVIRRMEKAGLSLIFQTQEARMHQAQIMEKAASERGITMQYCAMEGFPCSKCIDGELLSALHPDGLSCSCKRAKGQRKLCGCTESLDIGWYSLKCQNGCLYCYAEPLIA